MKTLSEITPANTKLLESGARIRVWFHGGWWSASFIRMADGFNAAICETNCGMLSCRPAEIITEQQHAQYEREERAELRRMEYIPVVKAFESGAKDSGAMAEKLGCSARSAGQRISHAKKQGWISAEQVSAQ